MLKYFLILLYLIPYFSFTMENPPTIIYKYSLPHKIIIDDSVYPLHLTCGSTSPKEDTNLLCIKADQDIRTIFWLIATKTPQAYEILKELIMHDASHYNEYPLIINLDISKLQNPERIVTINFNDQKIAFTFTYDVKGRFFSAHKTELQENSSQRYKKSIQTQQLLYLLLNNPSPEPK